MDLSSQPPAADRDRDRDRRQPVRHRTIDRVTLILEAVVARPGLTFSDLVRTLGAAKSSVHGFVQGLLANGWLHEERGQFYLGPALYGLTLASGQIRAGTVTYEDLHALHRRTGLGAYLGVRAGDHLIYVAVAGEDPVGDFFARSDMRRALLHTSGGKALLAAGTESSRESFLRRQPESESQAVVDFLRQLPEIRRTGIAFNYTQNLSRLSLATVVRSQTGEALAALTLVATAERIEPQREALGHLLRQEVARLEARQA